MANRNVVEEIEDYDSDERADARQLQTQRDELASVEKIAARNRRMAARELERKKIKERLDALNNPDQSDAVQRNADL